MSASDLVQELLPAMGARLAALATLAVTPVAWTIPHWASPLWPQSTQAEVLLAQAAAALLVVAVGSLVTLAFMVAHVRKIATEAANVKKDLETLRKNPAISKRSAAARPPDDRLAEIDERVLLFVTEQPGQTSDEIASALGGGEPLVLHHLEELTAARYIKDAHHQGSEWTGAQYRHEWNCDTAGRKYLAHHSLLK